MLHVRHLDIPKFMENEAYFTNEKAESLGSWFTGSPKLMWQVSCGLRILTQVPWSKLDASSTTQDTLPPIFFLLGCSKGIYDCSQPLAIFCIKG